MCGLDAIIRIIIGITEVLDTTISTSSTLRLKICCWEACQRRLPTVNVCVCACDDWRRRPRWRLTATTRTAVHVCILGGRNERKEATTIVEWVEFFSRVSLDSLSYNSIDSHFFSVFPFIARVCFSASVCVCVFWYWTYARFELKFYILQNNRKIKRNIAVELM